MPVGVQFITRGPYSKLDSFEIHEDITSQSRDLGGGNKGCHCKGILQWAIKEENDMTFACSEVTIMPYLVKAETANSGAGSELISGTSDIILKK